MLSVEMYFHDLVAEIQEELLKPHRLESETGGAKVEAEENEIFDV